MLCSAQITYSHLTNEQNKKSHCPWLKEHPQSQSASKARRMQGSNNIQQAENTQLALQSVDPETRDPQKNDPNLT